MKTLLIILSISLSINLFADELKWVDEQIQSIKPPRVGISKSKINGIDDPFVFLSKNKDKSDKSAKAAPKQASSLNKTASSNANKVSKESTALVLYAIINKSALINGMWYKEEDKIGNYTLSSIDNRSVILKYNKKELLLSTDSQSRNIKFKNN